MVFLPSMKLCSRLIRAQFYLHIHRELQARASLINYVHGIPWGPIVAYKNSGCLEILDHSKPLRMTGLSLDFLAH
jgi:hypothetical protein